VTALRPPQFRTLALLGLCIAATTALFCSDEYNPFADPSNARAHIVDRSFGLLSEGDSVKIFSAETLLIVIALREKVDSVVLSAPGNRLGETLAWRKGDVDWSSSAPANAVLSFADTGTITLVLSTYRTNGDVVYEELSVRAWSPLGCPPILAHLGQPLTLSTARVDDNDVLYHWEFTPADVIVVPEATADTMLSGIRTASGNGLLWVSDARETYISPARAFTFALDDTVGPVISLPASDSDTFFTGDTVLSLVVSVVDNGIGSVTRVSVNGADMHRSDNQTWITVLHKLDTLEAYGPVPLVIRAEDLLGNVSVRAYYLIYDPSLAVSGNLILTLVKPTSDTTTTSSTSFDIIGRLQDFTADSLQAGIDVSVNGSSQGPASIRYLSPQQILWEKSVTLAGAIHSITITATAGAQVRDTTITVFYSPSFVDLRPPTIADIRIGSEPAADLRTEKSSDTLRIIAFDEGAGLDTLSVNNTFLWTADSQGNAPYMWSVEIQLVHALAGNPFVVRAVDRAGNVSEQRVVVYQNRLPVVDHGLVPRTPIRVGQTYRDTLRINDRDGDVTSVELVSAPAGFAIDNYAVVWTPADSQAHRDNTVILRIGDGIGFITYTTSLPVLEAGNAPCSLSVNISDGVLTGDRLVLYETSSPAKLTFTIDDPDPTSTEFHTVTISRGNHLTIETVDTTRLVTVTIDPSTGPFGIDTLVVIATDQAGHSDTVAIVLDIRRIIQDSTYAVRIAFNGTLLSSALSASVTRFPLLVHLTSTTFDFSKAQDPAGLHFEGAAGHSLPYEIERWDPDSGRAELWVLVDSIKPTNASQYIRLVWSSAGSDIQQPHAVFDSSNGFRGVWHLNEDPSFQIRDRTVCANHGATSGDMNSADHVAGVAGPALDLDGSNDYVLIPSPAASLKISSSITLSAWARPSSLNSFWNVVVGRQYGASWQDSWTLGFSANTPSFQLDPNAGTVSGGGATIGQWVYLAGVRTGSSLILYVNGREVSRLGRYYQNAPIDDNEVTFGAEDNGSTSHPDGMSEFFAGTIDEVRISAVGRSADWIRLCYENQRPSSTLLTVTAE